MQSLYTLGACEDLINEYIERGGAAVEVEPGTLGLGLTICTGPGLKAAIIREIYVNCWSCAHTIRMYNKMPQKYAAMLEAV